MAICQFKSGARFASRDDHLLKQISVNHLDPIQKRALTQLLIGLEGSAAEGLRTQLNIDQDINAKATYTSVMAKAIQATAVHQSDQKMVTKDPAYALIMGESHTALESCNESIQQMEARLERLLRQKNQDHLTPNDVINMVIQGDPYGVLGDDPNQKAAIERLALNIMILRTETFHLKDCKADAGGYDKYKYQARPYLQDLQNVFEGTFKSPQAAYDKLRECAVYLACEHQLGHRLRDEQYTAVSGILSGKTRLAELRTGFGKTDVVLFLVALYKGYGKGVRMTSPDPLLTMNLKDINRKLGGMLMSVWQPQLDFNAIKEADLPTALSNFLIELKAHNQRGDIMFASHYNFDEQLDDLLNVCLVEKGKAGHVQQILNIKDELCEMAMNMDEVHTFDPNHKFNIMEGEEKFKDFKRVQLAEKVITTIHKNL